VTDPIIFFVTDRQRPILIPVQEQIMGAPAVLRRLGSLNQKISRVLLTEVYEDEKETCIANCQPEGLGT
jgi:hypothetical protein